MGKSLRHSASTMASGSMSDLESGIDAVVRRHVPDARLLSCAGGEIAFRLPKSDAAKCAPTLASISQPTINNSFCFHPLMSSRAVSYFHACAAPFNCSNTFLHFVMKSSRSRVCRSSGRVYFIKVLLELSWPRLGSEPNDTRQLEPIISLTLALLAVSSPHLVLNLISVLSPYVVLNLSSDPQPSLQVPRSAAGAGPRPRQPGHAQLRPVRDDHGGGVPQRQPGRAGGSCGAGGSRRARRQWGQWRRHQCCQGG